jgi:hypothetical protein
MLIDAAETAHTIQEAPGFAIHVACQPQSSRKAILTPAVLNLHQGG